MSETPKILILTADAGLGHRNAAEALATALRERYGTRCVVRIVNPLDDDRVPKVLRESQSDYDRLVRDAPQIYRAGYDLSDADVPASVVGGVLTPMLFETLDQLVRTQQPDAIVTTYPLYQAPLDVVFEVRGHRIPLLNVITDLVTVHALWFHRSVDLCFVATDAVGELALSHGLRPSQVAVTGIPVKPALLHLTGGANRLRDTLGWRTDLTTVLVVGSDRAEHLRNIIGLLDDSDLSIQIAAVAGGNDALHESLRAMKWRKKAHVYNFVENLPAMMHAADVIVCKAGGLILSESLAAGLPAIVVDVLPGQEVGNAEYLTEHGVGSWAHEPSEALKTLERWLSNDAAELMVRTRRARRLGRPRAAFDIAGQVWRAAERGI